MHPSDFASMASAMRRGDPLGIHNLTSNTPTAAILTYGQATRSDSKPKEHKDQDRAPPYKDKEDQNAVQNALSVRFRRPSIAAPSVTPTLPAYRPTGAPLPPISAPSKEQKDAVAGETKADDEAERPATTRKRRWGGYEHADTSEKAKMWQQFKELARPAKALQYDVDKKNRENKQAPIVELVSEFVQALTGVFETAELKVLNPEFRHAEFLDAGAKGKWRNMIAPSFHLYIEKALTAVKVELHELAETFTETELLLMPETGPILRQLIAYNFRNSQYTRGKFAQKQAVEALDDTCRQAIKQLVRFAANSDHSMSPFN